MHTTDILGDIFRKNILVFSKKKTTHTHKSNLALQFFTKTLLLNFFSILLQRLLINPRQHPSYFLQIHLHRMPLASFVG